MPSVRPGTVDYSRWDNLDSDEEQDLRSPFRPQPAKTSPSTIAMPGATAADHPPRWGGVDEQPSVLALKLVLLNDAALASLGEKTIDMFKTLPPPVEVQTREDTLPLFSGLKALVASLNRPRGVAMLAETSKALRGQTPAGFAAASQAAAQRLRFTKAALWLVDPRGGFNAWEMYAPELAQFVAAAAAWPAAPASLPAAMKQSFTKLISDEAPAISNPFQSMMDSLASQMEENVVRDARNAAEHVMRVSQEVEYNGSLYGGVRTLEAHETLSQSSGLRGGPHPQPRPLHLLSGYSARAPPACEAQNQTLQMRAVNGEPWPPDDVIIQSHAPSRLHHGHSAHVIELRCWEPAGFLTQCRCGARRQRRCARLAAHHRAPLTTAPCPPCCCAGPPQQLQTAAMTGRKDVGEAAAAVRRRHRRCRLGPATRAQCLWLKRALLPGYPPVCGRKSLVTRRGTQPEGGGRCCLAAGCAETFPTAWPGCLAPSTWTPQPWVTPRSCRLAWQPWPAPRTRRRGGPARQPTPEAAGCAGAALLAVRR